MIISLGIPIHLGLFRPIKTLCAKVVSIGSDGLIEVSSALTAIELQAILNVIKQWRTLGQYDSGKNTPTTTLPATS